MNAKRPSGLVFFLMVGIILSFLVPNKEAVDEQGLVAVQPVYTQIVATAWVVEITATPLPTQTTATASPTIASTPTPVAVEKQEEENSQTVPVRRFDFGECLTSIGFLFLMLGGFWLFVRIVLALNGS